MKHAGHRRRNVTPDSRFPAEKKEKKKEEAADGDVIMVDDDELPVADEGMMREDGFIYHVKFEG